MPTLRTTLFSLIISVMCTCGVSCNSWVAEEPVTIIAEPASALVYGSDGKLLGSTPLTLSFKRDRAHAVRLMRPGFKPYILRLLPERTEAGRQYPRLGILEDTGRYSRLSPNPADVHLQPTLVPDSLGSDPVAELARRTLAADELLANKQISPTEHEYIVRYLADFYQSH